MNVYVEKNPKQDRWWVQMDEWRISFKTANEARQFVAKLTARINAPHSRDMIADHALLASPHTGIGLRGASDQAPRRRAQEA
ncbi:hypothetical protein [Pseudomonas alkylphenolica]|uniref:Uncharacterized protein n=1 Tax=Pseudomonas alkylphenolica TaxID=237609 RepID=A0A077FD00_9PSED|nr:hypothetical protein [Pseudomonas alkylphenolica]AIL61724.1 hypothetical protein PSAKL28_25200 [Pseudomonas alkylphenolica]